MEQQISNQNYFSEAVKVAGRIQTPQFTPLSDDLDADKTVKCWLWGCCGNNAAWKLITKKKYYQYGDWPFETTFLCSVHAAIQMKKWNKKNV